MEINKRKILVLSDLNETTTSLLKSAISLAKMVDGSIEFLCVKKPTDIVEKENQLSAIRNINQEYFVIKKEMVNLITPICNKYDVNINHKLSYGNVKSEIGHYIKEYNPDIIVMGKRKPKMLNLMGDNITNFVFKKHSGVILVSADDSTIEPDRKIVVGLLNDLEDSFVFSNDLMKHTQKPLKSFKIVNHSNPSKIINDLKNSDVLEYVFEDNNSAITNLSNYLTKSKINLLCINREKKSNAKYSIKSDVNNIISKLNVSMLLTTNPK